MIPNSVNFLTAQLLDVGEVRIIKPEHASLYELTLVREIDFRFSFSPSEVEQVIQFAEEFIRQLPNSEQIQVIYFYMYDSNYNTGIGSYGLKCNNLVKTADMDWAGLRPWLIQAQEQMMTSILELQVTYVL